MSSAVFRQQSAFSGKATGFFFFSAHTLFCINVNDVLVSHVFFFTSFVQHQKTIVLSQFDLLAIGVIFLLANLISIQLKVVLFKRSKRKKCMNLWRFFFLSLHRCCCRLFHYRSVFFSLILCRLWHLYLYISIL